MGCNLCNSSLGARWTSEIHLGMKKVSTAAIEFNMTVDEVLDHINTHAPIEKETDIVNFLDDPDYIKREVMKSHFRLKDWLEVMLETEGFGAHNMNLGIKLIAENNKSLKLLADLDGKLNHQDQTKLRLIEVQNNIKMLTSSISECTCADCKKKLFERIREQKLLTSAINATGSTKEE